MTLRPSAVLLRRFWHAGRDFLRAPRAFVTNCLGFRRATDYDRWSRNDSLQTNWDERTLMMAAYIPAGAAVIEFGAGAQALPAALPADCRYQPSDLVARTPDTLVCDLNSGYPDLAGQADVAVFSGVLEYINDLPGLFDWLRGQVGRVVFSYATLEHTPSPLVRRQNGWVNDLTQDQITRIIAQAGFGGGVVTRWRGHVIFVIDHP